MNIENKARGGASLAITDCIWRRVYCWF